MARRLPPAWIEVPARKLSQVRNYMSACALSRQASCWIFSFRFNFQDPSFIPPYTTRIVAIALQRSADNCASIDETQRVTPPATLRSDRRSSDSHLEPSARLRRTAVETHSSGIQACRPFKSSGFKLLPQQDFHSAIFGVLLVIVAYWATVSKVLRSQPPCMNSGGNESFCHRLRALFGEIHLC